MVKKRIATGNVSRDEEQAGRVDGAARATEPTASRLAAEYAQFRDREDEKALLKRLQRWSSQDFQKETSAENDFVRILFTLTWGYREADCTHWTRKSQWRNGR